MRPNNHHIQKTIHLKGIGLVECVTVTGLAKFVGKSRNSILRYEASDILPLAPITIANNRYYPLPLVKKLIPIISAFPKNRRPDAEVIVKIDQLFKEEKNRLCQLKTEQPQAQ